jgi:hypothetical protein
LLELKVVLQILTMSMSRVNKLCAPEASEVVIDSKLDTMSVYPIAREVADIRVKLIGIESSIQVHVRVASIELEFI